MNLLRYFEGQAMKTARSHTDSLKRLVEQAKGEQLEAEERLREKLAKARQALERPPLSRAITWGRNNGQ